MYTYCDFLSYLHTVHESRCIHIGIYIYILQLFVLPTSTYMLSKNISCDFLSARVKNIDCDFLSCDFVLGVLWLFVLWLSVRLPFFTCIFRFWKLCNRLSLYFSCQLSYTLYKTFYFHLSNARAKVFPKPFTSGFSSFIVRFWHLTFILSFTFRVNARLMSSPWSILLSMAVFVFVSTGLLLSSLLLLNEKLNNVFCPGKFSNLCFFFLFKSLKFKRLWSNKCYTILKLISRGLIICIIYYFWINTFWEILN